MRFVVSAGTWHAVSRVKETIRSEGRIRRRSVKEEDVRLYIVSRESAQNYI